MIIAGGILWGLVLSIAAGGHLRALGDAHLRYQWLLIAVFLAQGLVRGRIPYASELHGLAVPLWATASVLVLLILAANFSIPNLWVMALGLSLNLLVVLLNAGMPVTAGTDDLPATAGAGGFYHAASMADVALLAGDVVPAPGALYVSLGDLLLMVGSAAVVLALCCGTPHSAPSD